MDGVSTYSPLSCNIRHATVLVSWIARLFGLPILVPRTCKGCVGFRTLQSAPAVCRLSFTIRYQSPNRLLLLAIAGFRLPKVAIPWWRRRLSALTTRAVRTSLQEA